MTMASPHLFFLKDGDFRWHEIYAIYASPEAQVHGACRSQEGPDPDRMAHWGPGDPGILWESTRESTGMDDANRGVGWYFFHGHGNSWEIMGFIGILWDLLGFVDVSMGFLGNRWHFNAIFDERKAWSFRASVWERTVQLRLLQLLWHYHTIACGFQWEFFIGFEWELANGNIWVCNIL